MTKTTLYNAWFCPFAQRAWIGVLYRGLDIDVKEHNPYEKTPEWLKINPRGLVPALIHNNQSIYESTVLLEYLDEAFPSHVGPTLLPQGNAFKRFQARVWGDYINKKLVPPFYRMLQRKSKEEKDEAGKEILEGLKYMFDEKPYNGPYYMGDEPNYVDFMLIPYALRYKVVLKSFYNFVIPEQGYEIYHKWYKNVLELECVQKTLVGEEKLRSNYNRYADDSTQSLVAIAIRKGKALP